MGLRDVLFNSIANGRSSEPDSETDDEEDELLHEWQYRYQPKRTERVQGAPVRAHGVDTDPALSPGSGDREVVFAADRARRMMRNTRWDDDAPFWIGVGTRRGRDVGIEQRSMFRHVACFGTNGYGKSTVMRNLYYQIAELGAGGCYIDPGGDDSEQLLATLPAHRLDDVIWIEPGSIRGRVSGFNFLSPPISPESPQFDNAVESLVADFRHMLGMSQGWGARMDGVTASLIRASAQTQYEFTPADLFYIIEDPENSRRFAEAVRASGLELLADSADKIADVAEQDSNALEPLWRRFKDWVESPIARQFMSLRDSPIDLASAVENNKLIIVRMGSEDEDLKQMIGTAIFRRIWSIIRARAEMDRSDRTPFYMIADEFDNLASQDGAIDKMLSESRKYRLSLFLSCQAPHQISGVMPSLAANCDTWASFSPSSRKDSRLVANNIGMDTETLQRDVPYHFWMTLDLPEKRQASEPFRAYSLPEMPPRLTRAERDALIEEKLRDHGVPTQTAEEVRDAILIRGGEGALERSGALGRETMVTEDNIPTDTILESIFIAAVRASDDDDGTMPVPTDRVYEEFETRTGIELSEAKFSNQLEEAYGEFVEPVREGTEKVMLTDAGQSELFKQDTGSTENAGGPAHRYILRESLKTFLALGADASLPSQEGEELPDGVANLPINPLADATSDAEYQQLKQTCETEYGRLYEISGGKDIAIEAETTTLQKPKQTLTNLRKAVEQGKKCVFTCKDGSYAPEDFDDPNDIPGHTSLFEYWPRRGERVIYDTEGHGQNITADFDRLTFVNETTTDGEGQVVERIFYNKSGRMMIEPGVGALRPRTSNSLQWRERSTGDATTDTEIVLEDKGDRQTIRGRFENAEAVFNADRDDVPAFYEQSADGVAVHGNGAQNTYETKAAMRQDFKPIRLPFIPEREFTDASGNTHLPPADDFMFIVYPDDNNDEFDGPHIYEHGELRPLIPDESDGEQETAAGNEASQKPTTSTESKSTSSANGQVVNGNTDQQRHTATESRDSNDAGTTEEEGDDTKKPSKSAEDDHPADQYTLF